MFKVVDNHYHLLPLSSSKYCLGKTALNSSLIKLEPGGLSRIVSHMKTKHVFLCLSEQMTDGFIEISFTFISSYLEWIL